MESNKLTVEEFARKNIGKSFKTFDKDYTISIEIEAMIVGYNSFKQLLICSVTEFGGWRLLMKMIYFLFIVLLIIVIFI